LGIFHKQEILRAATVIPCVVSRCCRWLMTGSDNNRRSARPLKLAILTVFLFSASSNAETQSHSYFGRTTDPTPVDIAIQDKTEIVHFTIPKVFMTFAKNWDGGLQSGITLEVIFPSMAPVSATRNSSAGSDVVYVDLVSFAHMGGNYSIANTILLLMKTQWAFVENVKDGRGRAYRVYVNKEDVEKIKNGSSLIKEFLVPDDSDVYFECLKEVSNPYVGCIGTTNYGETLSLRYIFRRSEFEKWPEIQRALVSLFNSFRRTSSPQ
jgi:hypothetical protein